MKAYLDILRQVLDEGVKSDDRTDTGTIRTTGAMFKHNMQDGFPLVTTKKVNPNTVFAELEFFNKGITDKQWLKDHKCKIWNQWAFKDGRMLTYSKETQEIYAQKSNDLGVVYGFNWRNFGGTKTFNPPNANIPYLKVKESINGITYKSKYGDYIITKVEDTNSDNIHVQFTETGYETVVGEMDIKNENVIDPYFKSYFGVACDGPFVASGYCHTLKNIWLDIISKCYNKNDNLYSCYGEIGVYVSNDWLIYSNFHDDVLNKYNKELTRIIHDHVYDIESGDKCFSIDNCNWISTNSKTFSKYNIYRFNATKGIDQLEKVVNTIKTNPTDRRMIVTAWNPLELEGMALPPCHHTFQFTSDGEYLDLTWHQRSVDVFLGLPFNIASYGMLLELVAATVGKKPRLLVGLLVDVHIYSNHLEQVNTQLKRETKSLPKLTLPDDVNVFDWTCDQYKLDGYEPHPFIKAPIAI